MKLDFNCKPLSGNPAAQHLVFSWDPDRGELGGPGAVVIRERIADGAVVAHPMPWGWTLGDDPLRSWQDMAAIVGSEWELPAELVPHYPRQPDAEFDGTVRDERGRVIGNVQF